MTIKRINEENELNERRQGLQALALLRSRHDDRGLADPDVGDDDFAAGERNPEIDHPALGHQHQKDRQARELEGKREQGQAGLVEE